MDRKVKRDYADKGFPKPAGIEARLAHARRHLTRQRREKAEEAFQKSLRDSA